MVIPEIRELFQQLCLISILIEIITCSVDVSIRVGKEGKFSYGNFHKRINESVLNKTDSILSKLQVDSDIECASLCVMHKLCLSVNFGVQSGKAGKVDCELLSFGGTDYRNHLIKKEKFFHMRIETVCSGNPCANEKLVCTPHLGKFGKLYSCDCPGNCKDDIKYNALGIEDGTIQDSQITASSESGGPYAGHEGRLNNAVGSWLPAATTNQWLQVNLLNKTFINGVATQGRHDAQQFISVYQLSYSDDGATWVIYKERGTAKDFVGNTNHQTIVKNLLEEPFTAKLVRIYLKAYYSFPGLRIELYGCYL